MEPFPDVVSSVSLLSVDGQMHPTDRGEHQTNNQSQPHKFRCWIVLLVGVFQPKTNAKDEIQTAENNRGHHWLVCKPWDFRPRRDHVERKK